MFVPSAFPATQDKPEACFFVKKHCFLFLKEKQGNRAIVFQTLNFCNRLNTLFYIHEESGIFSIPISQKARQRQSPWRAPLTLYENAGACRKMGFKKNFPTPQIRKTRRILIYYAAVERFSLVLVFWFRFQSKQGRFFKLTCFKAAPEIVATPGHAGAGHQPGPELFCGLKHAVRNEFRPHPDCDRRPFLRVLRN